MDDASEPKYKYEIRSRGGSGRSQVNEWSVYGPERLHALESGEVTGGYAKAKAAGSAAVQRWILNDKGRGK